jgi:RNA polymerase sigma-70 factor, ECF subfamily
MATPLGQQLGGTTRLLEEARSGHPAALNAVSERHRARLRRMAELRLDRRLQSRIDASGVAQEAYVDAVRRLDEYLSRPD